jgi:predicted PurR-regulated permease PerM
MVWAVIMAVTLHPLHRALARRIGGRQGLAAALLVLASVSLLVFPSALLLNSFGTSVSDFIRSVQENTLQIPPPRDGVRGWPIVGEKIQDAWSQAHANLPGFVQSLQPTIGELARKALSMVASIGVGVLQFLASRRRRHLAGLWRGGGAR